MKIAEHFKKRHEEHNTLIFSLNNIRYTVFTCSLLLPGYHPVAKSGDNEG